MFNGNTLTELPVQWSEWPVLPATSLDWSNCLTCGLVTLLSVWKEKQLKLLTVSVNVLGEPVHVDFYNIDKCALFYPLF